MKKVIILGASSRIENQLEKIMINHHYGFYIHKKMDLKKSKRFKGKQMTELETVFLFIQLKST